MSQTNRYQETVDYIESFSVSTIRKNLGQNKKDPSFFIERIKYFLNLIGNPEKGLSYVHITGTAGKGTVSTMMQEVLIASGKVTGLFTSPHTTTTIEKIKVGEKYISPKDFIEIVEDLKPYIIKSKDGPYSSPSSFELLLAIAFIYFKKQKCEWVVLEVGLGGRYDATNVITNPIITAITNIDYDHTEVLGNTLREIATDKSGIIKAGSAFFTSEQKPVLQNLFKKVCKKQGATFHKIERQKNYTEYNRRLVEEMAKHLGLADHFIKQGIKNTKIPCRFETIQENPTVIIDGAHNRAKILSTIFNLKNRKFKKLHLLLAIADNKKDNRAIIKPLMLLPYQKNVIITQIKNGGRKTLSPKLLFKFANKHNKKGDMLSIVDEAKLGLEQLLKSAHKDDLILVTGSFFLAGEIRKRWFSEDRVLKERTSF